MTVLLIYLAKTAAWLTCFYLLYLLLFRRFNFFAWNRAYLLLVLAASFLLPLVQYSVVSTEAIMVKPVQQTPVQNLTINEPAATAITTSPEAVMASGINWVWVAFIVYLAGFLPALFRFVLKMATLYRVVRRSPKERMGKFWLVYAPEPYVHASFFNYIFLKFRRNENPECVLEHEQAHARRLHSLDVLLCECLCIIQWFNPIARLFRKSLCEIHEFEADALTTQKFDKEKYASTLLQLALPGRTALANQFSRHPLKSRITRLFTPKTNNMKKMLFLLVIPVTIVMLFAFKNIRHKKVQVWKTEPLTVMIDAGHGGSDPGVQVNGVMEKDLTLAISEKIKKHATAAGINVMMTRSSNEAKPAIIERVQMAEAARPDLLLSIHINNTNGGNTRNGIECYAGGNNAPQQSAPSVQAAKQVLRSLAELGEIKVEQQLQSRGMSIGILKLSPCPAILLECGYLNNSNDFNFITSEEKQDAMARKIVQGILAYARERAVVTENQPANDLGAEPVALEGKIPQLYQFPENGNVWIDGKQVAHSVLADINPELIKHHVYYEPNNAVAINKYGKAAAENGLVVLHTKSGKGEYAFIGETEKNKWLEVARAIRRISTTTKYDRFSYTGIDGKTSEVLVLAGGRPPAQNPAFTRFVVGMYGGKPLGAVKFAIDGVNYTEETFVKKLAQLPVNGYEIVYPFPVQKAKTGSPIRVEIKVLDKKEWSLQGLMQNILPPLKKESGDGC